MRSRLMQEAIDTLHNYPVSDDGASRVLEALTDQQIDDSDYQPTPDDISVLSFTERLLSDPMLWNDHVVEALGLDSDAFSIKVMSAVAWIKKCDGKGDFEVHKQLLGNMFYKAVIAYGERLESEGLN